MLTRYISVFYICCASLPTSFLALGSPNYADDLLGGVKRSEDVCRAEGYFPNSKDCKKFYRCVENGYGSQKFTKYDFDCAPGTSFDTATSSCNFEHSSQCVATNTPAPTPVPPTEDPDDNECVYELNLAYRNASPDGTLKKMMNFNKQFPGPTLTCEFGKFLVVRVNNYIDEPTSIHWHGIEQNLSPFYDGPESITQCPIMPHTSMVYRFQLFQSGTYWYHSHHSNQYVDGAWGALIISNKKSRGEVWRDLYDHEIILTLNDWHHTSARTLGDRYLKSEADFPIPDSILVNGVGSSNCKKTTLNDRDCYPNLNALKPAVINVIPNKRYRIRVINTSASSSFMFSIDGHKLRTIETDGVDTVVVEPVDAVQIWTAQRYSFLLTANGAQNEYWIRANGDIGPARGLAVLKYERNRPLPAGKPSRPESLEPANQGRPPVQNIDYNFISSQRACSRSKFHGYLRSERFPNWKLSLKSSNLDISRASETSITLPTTTPPKSPVVLNQDDCSPYHQGAASDAPDHYDRLIVVHATSGMNNCSKVNDSKPHFCFNGVQFVPGDSMSYPALFQMIRGEPITNGGALFETPYMNEVVQLVINNQATRSHPWHLHGHTFWVLGTGAPGDHDYDPAAHNLTLKGVRRDTTPTPGNSWVVLRYYTGNPGAWLLHCHINWHLAAGFGGVIIEAQKLAQQVYCSPPQEAKNVCKRAGVEIF